MKSVRVFFPPRHVPGVLLEGEILEGREGGPGGGRPCVVSHPHPLAGGTMHHPVAEGLWRAAAEAGLRALRYNFRGVGESTGQLTTKSPLAIADLLGAIDHMGGGPILAIGYSYGARVTLHAIHDGAPIERAVLAGLPTRSPGNAGAMANLLLGRRVRTEQYVPYTDPELVASSPRPLLIIAGEKDPLVEADEYRSRGIEPVLLPGLNHFFSRRLGNEPPDPEDMAAVCDRAMKFLLSA
jgi:alpha/beta superfamily hydrolase